MSKKLFVLPVIRETEYDAFRRSVGTNLADSYNEWRKLFADDIAEAKRRGYSVIEIVVNYDEFIRFCTATGTKPDPQVLLNFAEQKIPRENK